MKRIGMFVAAMALVAVLVTACGGSSSKNDSTNTATATSSESATSKNSPTATAGATITIENMAFGKPVTVAPGAEVRIVNNDTVEHSVTSDTAGVFDQDVDGEQKATLIAPKQAGEYPFHCSYHPNMKGTLIVK
jgi:plastocyanin